eukprot:TRINITY_DN2503_c0_g1_i4.p1 TRINITY_DN2503_c0_g1~~TRINITY_DN2503_c0_g1_i4.p1  ORF type:complete len:502 (+),score=105.31 TRINITY_DN2503_c0_g1_i4:141-1508(+)
MEERPVQAQVEPGYLRPLIPDTAPEDSDSWESIKGDIERVIMPGVTHWQHPNFFAYFPANASFPAMVADMLSGAINCIGFSWVCSPACTELETVMMDWLAKILKLPDVFLSSGKGGGVIQGTASEAVIVCILAARDRALRRLQAEDESKSKGELTSKLVAYMSDQTHSSVQKGCMIAGVQFRALVTGDYLTVTPAILQAALDEDRAKGLIPFFLCSTVGTTAACAMDDIPSIGPMANENNLWLHVDAAYAGSACVCPEYRPMINGVEFADSFNFNLHKWLLVNFDCSVLWVRNRSDLLDALSITPEYLRNRASESGLVTDYKDWQLPLGRRFRSLKIWFMLRAYGVKGLQNHIRNHIHLASLFEELVRSDDRFEVVFPRKLSLVCFRLKGSNDLNAALNAAIEGSHSIFIIHAKMHDQYILRFVPVSEFCEERHIHAAWNIIVEHATKVLAEHKE